MKLRYGLAAGSLVVGVRGAADLISALGKLPACGVECFTAAISSSSCPDLNDATCICADDTFYKTAHDCILDNCSVLEALEVARIEGEACERPVRSRKRELFIPLAIEIPAWICPWLRLYSRWTSAHSLAVDDYLMLVCGVLYTVFVVLGAYTGQLAFGVDTWTVDPSVVTKALKIFYVDESFYLACLGLTKVSMLCFYLRIFPNRSFVYSAYLAMAFVAIPTIVFIFLQIFQCAPVSYIWEGWVDGFGKHQCINVNTLAYAAASFSIAQDFIILVLPLPLLYSLNMGSRSKAGIMIMFSLGIFIMVTSCVRLRYILSFGATTNPCWDYADPLIWTGLEAAVSIIVACLPAIRVLVNRLMPGMLMTILSRTPDGYVKEGGSSGSAAISGKRRHGSRSRSEQVSNIFASQTEDNDSQIELGLRLGDKVRGEVQTEIIGGEPGSSRKGDDQGIRVMTTTTTAVDADALHRAPYGREGRSLTPSL